MEKIVYLFKKHFMLRLVATIGLCVLAAIIAGSGLRGPSATVNLTPVDLEQPARLSTTSTTSGTEAGSSVAASNKNNPASTSLATTSNTTNNVSSLSQAIKILAAKPVDSDAGNSVAAGNSTGVKTTGGQAVVAPPEAALGGKNNATSSQNNTGAAKGR